ncbi:WD40 repeat domain-containing serine/threonine protein kinase [Tautonia plasticadhaerens]|uniref:non-specific serine/threonine protein kinase n=1 Tax=Tautonia plasticadhaerens TaxID=2527974 RepID=A0A518GUS0_9BACT|nr:protein kinase [Tautonia plasticadhaerens]QDV32337.1 Serine/threonine-protein kinase PrkC [Tautonia plasticadhaerens]
MPLDPSRVQRVFLEVVELPDPEGYPDALDRACGADSELKGRVEALLRAHHRPDARLDRPIADEAVPGPGPLGSGSWYAGDETTARPSAPAPAEGRRSEPEFDLDRILGRPARREEAVRPAAVVDGYEVQGELGRGGMGVVYKARQVVLDRPCVLKMILGGVHARPEAAARFLVEAQSIARLHHPNIVQIYHVGEWDGLTFLELEYVEGGGLDRVLDGTPWEARRAAGLVEPLGRAVAEAHRREVVHRDIKPANILIAADGSPKLSDFGLAKALGVDSGLTATEAIMGSPSYMAPEQAEGKTRHSGPKADVYSLGAVLYELLTGRPPFKGATLLETLEQTRSVEPIPPSRLVPGVPRDLETIALKCLQKDPARRYESAGALADDLSRFLAGEPIVARRVSAAERAWRWCRRHPSPAALTAAVVLVAALGLIGVLWQWQEAVRARDLAATRATAEADARRQAEASLVELYAASGIAAGDQGDYGRAALWFANAARKAEADPDRRSSNAIRSRTWGDRAIRPLRAVVADGAWPGGLRFHPGGHFLLSKTVIGGSTRDAEHSLWDLDRERPIPFPGGPDSATAASWSPDGSRIAFAGEDEQGGVVLRPFPDGGPPTRIPFPGRIRLLEFGDGGRLLAIAGGNVARVWDVRAGAFASPALEHPEAVTTLAIHPEGRSLATGCLDQQARLFALPKEDGEPTWPPVRHLQAGSRGPWDRLFFAPPMFVDGGRGLITWGGEGDLTWRSTATGEVTRTLESPELSGRIAGVEASPDGRYVAAFGHMLPANVRVFELSSGEPVGPILEHENTISGVCFSPDGRTLLTGSTDNTARLWSVPDGTPLARPLDLHRAVQLVAFAPGGRAIATQDGDLIRLWGLPRQAAPKARLPLDNPASFVSISPDGTLAIPTGVSFEPDRGLRSVRAYRISTGRPAGPGFPAGGVVIDAAFSPDGRSVAVLGSGAGGPGEGPSASCWDWSTGRRRWRSGLPSEPRSLAYRPDGRRLAVLCGGGELLVFDPADGREVRRWQAHEPEPAHHWVNNGEARYSPDGRSILTWGMGNDLRAWEADSGRPRFAPISHEDKCHDVRFSPDGLLLATASYDGSVRVRDVETGATVAELPEHPDIVYSAAFSPDGRLLATACRDREVRVWDWEAGRLACPPFEHEKDAVEAVFSPDGRLVLSVGNDATARAWDWRSGKPLMPPLRLDGNPMSIVAAPDGRHAVVGGFLGALAVIDLSGLAPGDAVDPVALCHQAELLSGQRLHDGGGTVNLSADEWLERWRGSRGRTIEAMASP